MNFLSQKLKYELPIFEIGEALKRLIAAIYFEICLIYGIFFIPMSGNVEYLDI